MSDDMGSAASRLPLTPLTYLILAVLREEPHHGYAVIQGVETLGGLRQPPGTGTFYSALRRMVDEGLLETVPQPHGSGHDGRRAQYYGLTEAGREVLAAETRRLERVIQAVGPHLIPTREQA